LNRKITDRFVPVARRKESQRPRFRHAGSAFSAGMLVLLLLLSQCVPARAQESRSVEYQVKAAFLLNFAKFVDWPADAFENETAPINFCVFRQDPFGRALADITQGKSINNRGLQIRHIQDVANLKSCQIVFLSDAAYKQLPEVLDSLKGSSALVVGESEGFAERGGGIQFYLEDGKVRFSVNVDATKRARLTVSSKLLALARIVHDQGNSKGN
jgi:hypothetical protein